MDIINSDYNSLKPYTSQFVQNKPFPHILLNNFFKDEFFENINCEVEKFNDKTNGKNFNSTVEKNKWISLNSRLPHILSMIIHTLNTESWLTNLEDLTKIKFLTSTINDNTNLANYHEMKRDGFLGSHVDHSFEIGTGYPHVLNIILYISDQWSDNFGGGTTFFDKDGNKLRKVIQYKPNTALIFLHSPFSFHGVEVINSDCLLTRRTIYIDYYSKSHQPFENLELPFDKKFFPHGTTFKLPNLSNYLKKSNIKYIKPFVKYTLNKHLHKFNISIGQKS